MLCIQENHRDMRRQVLKEMGPAHVHGKSHVRQKRGLAMPGQLSSVCLPWGRLDDVTCFSHKCDRTVSPALK
jgi:hypothetical protein